MTQGFDEFYGSLELQCLNTQEVGELCFEEGAASRQVEIDLLEKEIIETQCFLNRQNCIKQAEINELKHELEILQGMHNAVSITAGELIDERDGLQKQIDDALDYVFGLYCTGDLDTERLENILKGESNE